MFMFHIAWFYSTVPAVSVWDFRIFYLFHIFPHMLNMVVYSVEVLSQSNIP